VEFGDPPNAIYIRRSQNPLTGRPGRRPNGKRDRANGQGNVDHLRFRLKNFQLDSVGAEFNARGWNPKPTAHSDRIGGLKSNGDDGVVFRTPLPSRGFGSASSYRRSRIQKPCRE